MGFLSDITGGLFGGGGGGGGAVPFAPYNISSELGGMRVNDGQIYLDPSARYAPISSALIAQSGLFGQGGYNPYAGYTPIYGSGVIEPAPTPSVPRRSGNGGIFSIRSALKDMLIPGDEGFMGERFKRSLLNRVADVAQGRGGDQSTLRDPLDYMKTVQMGPPAGGYGSLPMQMPGAFGATSPISFDERLQNIYGSMEDALGQSRDQDRAALEAKLLRQGRLGSTGGGITQQALESAIDQSRAANYATAFGMAGEQGLRDTQAELARGGLWDQLENSRIQRMLQSLGSAMSMDALPLQVAGVANQLAASRAGQASAGAQQGGGGSGLGGLFGGIIGSAAGPLGSAAGKWLGSEIFG